jgi:hypothetical protein
MTKEQLIAAGLTEQQADAVLKLHKESIDGNYIPKATFDAERNKVKELDQQVKDRDKQITELGTFKGTAEELTKKVSELETKNKTDKDAADARVTQLEQDYLIKSEIGSMVYDADDVMSKLDKTKIVFKDGKIVAGLKEQAEELKKSKPHYFKPDQTTQQQNKVPGFQFFGSTPKEGQQQQPPADPKLQAAEFGKQLAQSKTGAQSTVLENGAKTYFN